MATAISVAGARRKTAPTAVILDPARPSPPRAAVGVVAWVSVLAMMTPPAVFREVTSSLDDSWYLGVVMGVRSHLQWGRDIFFPYGPLGFLSKGVYAYFGPWLLSLAAAILAHLLFLGAAAWLLLTVRARGRYWLLLAVLVIMPAPAVPSVEHELVLASFALLLISERRAPSVTAMVAAGLAGTLLAGLMMVKGTALLSGFTLLFVFAANAVSPRLRRAALTAVLSALFVLPLLWVGAGQQLTSLGSYVRGSMEIIGGYSSAMSVDGLAYYSYQFVNGQALAGFLLLCLTTLAAVYLAWRRDWAAARVLLLALPILFIDYKEGFVRFGDNTSIFYSMVVLVEATTLAALLTERGDGPRRRAPRAMCWTAMGLGCALLWGPGYLLHLTHFPPAWPGTALVSRASDYRMAASLLTSRPARLETLEEARAQMRHDFSLTDPELAALRGGASDVAPWDIGVVYAYGLEWRPRPVLQSYSAYTPYLDRVDAEAWSSPGRAPRLLYVFEGIDKRYPPWEEPAAFRAMLENYQPTAHHGPFSVLTPTAPTRAVVERRLASMRVTLNSPVEVPKNPGGIEYAAIHLRPTLFGTLVGLLYKPSPAWVEIAYGGGSRRVRHRLVVNTAADGVLVSRYLEGADDLRAMWAGQPGHIIDSLTVSVDDPAEYQADVGFDFFVRSPIPLAP